ncbi:hypothetical protein H4R27_001856 [Coemansia aciculifera]|nr:hypothetical protein H4R27_001856 [Coemansia aciculifera]
MSDDISIPLRELNAQGSSDEDTSPHSSPSLSLSNVVTRSPWSNSARNADGVLSPRRVRSQTNVTLSPAESRGGNGGARAQRQKRLNQRQGENSNSNSDREDGNSTRGGSSFDDILGDNDNDNDDVIANERTAQAASSGNFLSRLWNSSTLNSAAGGYYPVDVESGRNRNRRQQQQQQRGSGYNEPIWSRRMLLLPGILLLSMSALAGIVAAAAWLRDMREHPATDTVNAGLFPSGVDKARLSADQYALRLIHTNDVHARFHPHDFLGDACDPLTFTPSANRTRCLGGSAYVKSVIDHLRGGEGVQNSLLVDAGDEFQGSIFHTLFAGNVSARLLNAYAYDAVTLGNHEFDHGPELLAQYLHKVHAPAICANLDFLADVPELQSAIQSFAIIERHKVGIIGVLTPDAMSSSRVGSSINITDPIDAINRMRAKLNQRGIHRIIVLSHMGYDYDKQMAAKVESGISLIVGGHTHSYLGENDISEITRKPGGPYPTWIANDADREWQTAVIQAKSYGEYVGYLDAVFNDDGSLDSRLTQGHLVLVDVASADSSIKGMEPSSLITEVLRPFEVTAAEFTATVIGAAASEFPGPEGRQDPHELAIGNLVADALSWGADTEHHTTSIALVSSGTLRWGLPAGKLTRGDLMRTMPFDDTLGRITLSGKVLRSIVANGKKAVFSSLQASGLRYKADDIQVRVSVKNGDTRPFTGDVWEPLNDDKEYSVVAPMFILGGGDELISHEELDKAKLVIVAQSCRNIVEMYIKHFSPISPVLDQRK